MAAADYHLCAVCGGKAFYDANVDDPHYMATYDTSRMEEYFRDKPIGIEVLCWQCNKTHEVIVRKRGAA